MSLLGVDYDIIKLLSIVSEPTGNGTEMIYFAYVLAEAKTEENYRASLKYVIYKIAVET